MQTSPALFVMVGGCIWVGAMAFIAAISIYFPTILLHGNPIGIRCVLGCTGAIVGLPVGCLMHQMYSNWKTKISPDLLLNGWIGLIIPISLSNLILGFCTLIHACAFKFLGANWPAIETLLHKYNSLPYNCSIWWGCMHGMILIRLILMKDQDQIIQQWWPSFYETMHIVQEVLTPATRRIIDLRFAIRHQMMALAYTGFLEGTWILPKSTIEQLRSWSLHTSHRIQYRSQRTLASLNLFQNSYGDKLFVSLRNYPQEWGISRTILGESLRANTRLLLTSYSIMSSQSQTKVKDLSRTITPTGATGQSSQDHRMNLLFSLCSNNLSLSSKMQLLLPSWSQALQSPYKPGDWLELRILAAGRFPSQGQSHLEDGSLVIITKAAPYIGQTVRVQIVHILHSVTGFIIFANLAFKYKKSRELVKKL